jgi:hypothetical protein
MDNSITAQDASLEGAEIVIRGVTLKGRTFRPSDWADRLAGLVSEMGTDHRLNYGPYVQPVTRAGVRCVVISRSMEQRDGPMFRFMLDFARDNNLEVVDGRLKSRE